MPDAVGAFEQSARQSGERVAKGLGFCGWQIQDGTRSGVEAEEQPEHDQALWVGAETVPLVWLGHEDIAGQQTVGESGAFENQRAPHAERQFEAAGMDVLGHAGPATRVVAVPKGRNARNAFALKVERTPFGRVDIFEWQRANRFAHDRMIRIRRAVGKRVQETTMTESWTRFFQGCDIFLILERGMGRLKDTDRRRKKE